MIRLAVLWVLWAFGLLAASLFGIIAFPILLGIEWLANPRGWLRSAVLIATLPVRDIWQQHPRGF